MNIIANIRKEIIFRGNADVKRVTKKFFKEKIETCGLKSKDVAVIAKDYFQKIKDLPKEKIFKLSEELWRSGNMEEAIVAIRWSHFLRKEYGRNDFKIFEKWVKNYLNNWAVCDTFCCCVMGDFLAKYPEYVKRVKKWVKSENRWVRRASAVSLIAPARKGFFLEEAFEIADSLIEDVDYMVQKGYGWLLKECSKTHQEEVYNFVIKRKDAMPRTAYRYALEKMPPALRAKAMEK
jgi:3-methyladenine DNA glycosylase AlkD